MTSAEASGEAADQAADEAGERAAGSAVRQPPWVWVYLISYPLVGVITAWQATIAGFRAILSDHYASVGEAGLYWVYVLYAILPVGFLVAALITVLTPGQRGRDLRRRYGLARSETAEAGEIRRFVTGVRPGVGVRFSSHGGQLARAYPIGFTRTRIAVFAPFLELWQEDRAAAEAVLRHELAHVQQREHLILGVGSPFSQFMRAWAVLFVPLTLLPAVFRLLAQHSLTADHFDIVDSVRAAPLNALTVEGIAQPTLLLVLPVAAIWLAELAADAWAAETAGPEAVVRAIARRRALTPLWSRVLGVFEHPPAALRRWLVRHRPSRLPGRAAVLAAWPAAVVLALVLRLADAVSAYSLLRIMPGTYLHWIKLLSSFYLREGGTLTLLAASVLLLVLWPVLGSRAVASRAPVARPPAAPYWLAAVLPVVLLAAAALGDGT